MPSQERSESSPANEESTSEQGSHRYSRYWAALVAASLFLALVEYARYVALQYDVVNLASIGVPTYLFGIIVILLLAALLNLGLPTLVLAAIGPNSRWRRPLVLLAASIFAVLWHNTMMQGDGIRSHPLFELIRAGSLLAMVLGVVGFTYLIIFPGRLSDRLRRLIAGAILLVAVAVSQWFLPLYTAFHGYLVAFEIAVLAWLIEAYIGKHHRQKVLLVGLSLLLVFGWVLLPERDAMARYIQRYSHLPKSLAVGLPLSRGMLMEAADDLLSMERSVHFEGEVKDIESELADARQSVGQDKRGNNVLLIVLESVRADVWVNEELTPNFHEWKANGVYFPRAAAQYPATPLAYGAMFVSQPPSVLVQTPQWIEERPFDLLADEFDHLILTQPAVEWFDHSAISNFFVPDEAEPNRHDTSREALEHLRQNIQNREEDTFFAWAHLYEPHAPYQLHNAYSSSDGPRAAYASEVSYVDDQLGEFMNWFYRQPVAENTLVVVLSDHGEGLGETIQGEAYWGHHVHVDNVVSWIPAYFSGPGLPQGVMEPDLGVGQLDVIPTIMDFVGHPVPEHMPIQGWSLYTLLEQRPIRPLVTEAFSIRGKDFFDHVARVRALDGETAAAEFRRIFRQGDYSPKIALQYGKWKVHFDRTTKGYTLFNVDEDPWQRIDVAHEEPDTLDAMKYRLQAWEDRQRFVIDALNERNEHVRWQDRLYTPTYLTKIEKNYFLVDCWHNRILYSPELSTDLSQWSVLDENLAGPHSIASNGRVLVVDDTGFHRVKVYDARADGFPLLQVIDDVGLRPHRVAFDENTDAFFVLGSRSQTISRLEDRGHKIELVYTKKLDFLQEAYTRSFSIIDGFMFFTSGPNRVHKVRYDDDSYANLEAYEVPSKYARMNDIFRDEAGFYISVTYDYRTTEQIPENTIIYCADLTELEQDECEDLKTRLGLKGIPYYLSKIGSRYYIPQINQYNGVIVAEQGADGLLTPIGPLFDFGRPKPDSYKERFRLPK